MIALHITGVLGDCETFECPLDIEAVRRLSARTEPERRFLLELVHELSGSESTKDRDLHDALWYVLGQRNESLRARSAQDTMRIAVERKYGTAADMATILPTDQSIILVDENNLFGNILPDLHVFPFPEREGQYNGLPANSEVAILELERLRRRGATFIVFAWPSLWWLDHYAGFRDYLQRTYHCVLQNDHLAVFDLHPDAPATALPVWSKKRVSGSV
jgi:hypothetical protein